MGRAIVAAGLLICAGAFGQAGPAFEVASVKPSPPITGNNLFVSMGGRDPSRVNYTNATLRMVMSRAYNVKMNQITGPDWIDSARFEIVATVPPNTPRDQVSLMLQNLLVERFQLKLHREQKVMPVYALVPGKGASKLREVKAEDDGGRIQISMGPKGRQLTGNLTMARLADAISNNVDRPVLDMTELKGTYDINLEWMPDENSRGPMIALGAGRPDGAGPGPGREARENSDAPTIFTAVQEKLGLKLESKKSPVEILVIDHAEKVPTEN